MYDNDVHYSDREGRIRECNARSKQLRNLIYDINKSLLAMQF